MKTAATVLILALGSAAICLAQNRPRGGPPAYTRESEVALFDGRDFSGFTFCMKDHADPLKTWSVTNGVIHCTGQPAGYLRTTGVYSNYFLTVVWRFVKVTPKADNTGVLVHIQPPDKIWPQCIQIQGKHGRQGDLFLMAGAESKEHRGKNADTPIPMRSASVEHPVGEWNKCEVICLHNKVTVFINGQFMNETTACSVNSGCIGIQSEGGEIEIQSLTYSPLKF
jgi:hypothetical protein